MHRIYINFNPFLHSLRLQTNYGYVHKTTYTIAQYLAHYESIIIKITTETARTLQIDDELNDEFSEECGYI